MELKQSKLLLIVLVVTTAALGLVRYEIYQKVPQTNEVYFLDVGQGDSSLIRLTNGTQVLIDGGPEIHLQKTLQEVLPVTSRTIDLLILTHADKDHLAGLYGVLENYTVGAVIGTGRVAETSLYESFVELLDKKKVPYIAVKEGDQITIGKTSFQVLAPSTQERLNAGLNETSLVIKLETSSFSILYTGDIGTAVEERLVGDYNLKTDILKVAHHGSKHSSSEVFLSKAAPKIAVISYGNNNYGHPSEEVLNRLKSVTNNILKTKEQGTLKIINKDGGIHVTTH